MVLEVKVKLRFLVWLGCREAFSQCGKLMAFITSSLAKSGRQSLLPLVLVRIAIAVIKHYGKKQLGKERPDTINEGSQGRNSRSLGELKQALWWGAACWLAPLLARPVFLLPPRTTCPGVAAHSRLGPFCHFVDQELFCRFAHRPISLGAFFSVKIFLFSSYLRFVLN